MLLIKHEQVTGGIYIHREDEFCPVCNGSYAGKNYTTTNHFEVSSDDIPCDESNALEFHRWTWEYAVLESVARTEKTKYKYKVFKSTDLPAHRYCWVGKRIG